MCWCDNVGARCRQRGCELKSASVFIRKSIRFKQFSPTGKMREYKMHVLKKRLLSLLKGQLPWNQKYIVFLSCYLSILIILVLLSFRDISPRHISLFVQYNKLYITIIITIILLWCSHLVQFRSQASRPRVNAPFLLDRHVTDEFLKCTFWRNSLSAI